MPAKIMLFLCIIFYVFSIDSLYVQVHQGVGHIWAIECIRRNTASLKKLSFMHVHRYIAAAILHDGQDNPLVYCSLESIYFDSVDFQTKFVRPTRSETPAKFVYFPKLEFLRVHGRYPYNYNMLFRGEDGHSTLKSLKITLELTFIETESILPIFVTNKFPNMRSIKLEYEMECPRYILHERTLPARRMRSINRILEAIKFSTPMRAFTIAGHLAWNIFAECMQRFSMFMDMQIIQIPPCELEFAQIIAVLRRAPYLRHLHCSFMGERLELDEICPIGIRTGFQTNFHPWGKYFSSLVIEKVHEKVVPSHLVTSIGLIAIACPRCVQIGISDFSRYKFNREKDMFTNKMFYGYHFDRMNINVSNKPEIVVNRRERVIFFLLLWDAYIV
ncbi:hypothetical protein GGF37_000475 [Kickxella alabastrina]|nr:hypothetical protein GGF37_000475 [Kickxella alabastrina]